MKSKSIALALCLLSPLPAQAEEHFDVRPDWLKRPNGEDVLAVWPREAWEKGLGGRASIRCRITLQGALADCSVLSEEPAGAGFGVAAIALSPQFLLKPGIRDGKAVESTLKIPIIFKAPDLPMGSYIPGAGTIGNSVALTKVPWMDAPTYDEVVAAYPKKARERGLSGRATLDCEFKADGRLENCNAIQEEPKSQGFAAAAKAIAPRFLGPQVLPNGASTKGVATQITFVFDSNMLDPVKRVVGKA
ncbi:MAG: energy transducer TonB, partial [Phenylobacterium sp.]|uniref:energy transducer TonB n=1 Tax=Phenylobacterium sp. TaxID=1871053 RepID=UPI00271BBFDB